VQNFEGQDKDDLRRSRLWAEWKQEGTGRGIVILIQVVRVQFRRLEGEKESPKIGYGMLDGTGSST
jgi:hypothetical protein